MSVVESDGAMCIGVPCKKQSFKTHKFAVKKNARRSAHAAGAVTSKVRPDLAKVAKAKASAVSRGIRSRKATSN